MPSTVGCGTGAPLHRMPDTSNTSDRIRLDGKFLRLGRDRFHIKGVTYGPFSPNAEGLPFPEEKTVRSDLVRIREMGANTLRLFHAPPSGLPDWAMEHGLRLLIDIPVHKYSGYLGLDPSLHAERKCVRETIQACGGHPALLGVSVTNEVPPDVARWSGARTIAARVDALIEEVKNLDAHCLCTFANFPPTEYLQPRHVDFVSFNVYLHQRRPFADYLARLQMQAGHHPLVLTEIGMDSIREGEQAQCEALRWQIETAFQSGLAGVVVFSYTDDWHTGGAPVEDWAFGLTTRDRTPKDSFHAVRDAFQQAPYYPLPSPPRVSVVVASYNGAKTLKACLESLRHLNYPDYEVLLVDDGSTDATPQIMESFTFVRHVPQRHQGLSVARNTGIAESTGELVAFLDADCRADPDWLHYLVSDLTASGDAGIGGPNYLPPDDSPVAAAVLVSPGGPAPVMLTDRKAEHIPGCNMFFRKSALVEVNCFDPVFQRAGDDVDICWRLQQAGHRIGFSPSALVWHYRRSTVGAYLRQQKGYGEAESILERKHPDYFNPFGGGLWRGRIYSGLPGGGSQPNGVIYHGVFGTGFFQTLYTPPHSVTPLLCTSLEFHVLITLPLLVLSGLFPFLWPLPVTSLSISLGVATAAASCADIPRHNRRWWSRPLVGWLFLLQPVVRGWARYRGRMTHQAKRPRRTQAGAPLPRLEDSNALLYYWHPQRLDRVAFLQTTLHRLEEEGWVCKPDTGWSDFDIEILGNRWSRLQLTTVNEPLPNGESVLHCRVHSAWSLTARILFWGGLALALLTVNQWAARNPWIWMTLLVVPLLGWFLEFECRSLLRHIAGFLDRMAGDSTMKRIPKPG